MYIIKPFKTAASIIIIFFITLIISKITPAALLAATWPTIPWETYKESNKNSWSIYPVYYLYCWTLCERKPLRPEIGSA